MEQSDIATREQQAELLLLVWDILLLLWNIACKHSPATTFDEKKIKQTSPPLAIKS
jgi:hypothetical protein